MYELRWYVPKSENGIKPILQYRTKLDKDVCDEHLRTLIKLQVWSDWKNVPTVEEK